MLDQHGRVRRGDWVQTYTDRAVWPFDPRADDLFIEDIAHGLACESRHCGGTKVPFYVGDHSLRSEEYVAAVFPVRYPHATPEHLRQARLATLVHDVTEFVFKDLPRPVKHDPALAEYRAAEKRFARVVEQWLGLPAGATEWPIVKEADNRCLATEKRDLRGPSPLPWKDLTAEPLPDTIVPRDWRESERDFLARFRELTEGQRPDTGPLPHYHHCPWCYERKPCAMECTIEGDLSGDGVNCGAHTVCDDCAQLAPPDRLASALEEDLPLAVRLDLDPGEHP